MSTSSIQTQLSYTAQASPLPATQSIASEQLPTPPKIVVQILPAEQAAKSAATQSEEKPEPKPQTGLDHTTRQTDVDWQTHELVYRVIDCRSGQVLSQSPDEALLRLRAYAKQVETQAVAAQTAQPNIARAM